MYIKYINYCKANLQINGNWVIQVLRNAVPVGGGGWGEGVNFPGKKRYEGVRFNVISVTRGWVGVQFPRQKSVT